MRLNKVSKEMLSSLQENYYKSFLAPLDDMWELGIIGTGQYYEILDDKRIGYLVLNTDNVLLEFYLTPENQLKELEVLTSVIENLKIDKAFACTYEPNFLGLCLGLAKDQSLNSFFYKHHMDKEISSPDEDIKCLTATHEMLDEAVEYSLKVMAVSKEWLKSYYEFLLETKSLIFFKLKNEIIGTGEVRPSKTSSTYANLGMTVSPDYRLKGLGSYIMNEMVKEAYKRGLKPICGTDISNIASQKAISKCGFKLYHRVFTIEF